MRKCALFLAVIVFFTLSILIPINDGNKANKETNDNYTNEIDVGVEIGSRERVEPQSKNIPGQVTEINILFAVIIYNVVSTIYIVNKKRIINSIQLSLMQELLKNIKQYPRGTIDNRTYVRYNNTIAILVRAVNGGTGNGRIQEINNRYGKFAYR